MTSDTLEPNTQPSGNAESIRRFGLIDPAAWRLVLTHLRPKLGAIVVFAVASLVVAALSLVTPVLIRYAFNVAAPKGDLMLFVWLGLILLASRLVLSGVIIWSRRLINRALTAAMAAFRLSILKSLLGFERSFYTRSDPSAVQPRFVQNTDRVEGMLSAVIIGTLPALFTCLFVGAFVVWLDYRVIGIFVIAAPFMYWVQRRGTQRIQHATRAQRERMEEFARASYFFIRHTDLVLMQAAEKQALDKQETAIDRLAGSLRGQFDAQLFYAQSQSLLATVLLALIIVSAGATVVTGRNTIGDVIAIFASLQILQSALANIFGAIPAVISGNESLTKLHDLARSGQPISYRGEAQHRLGQEIRLEDVSFSYDRAPILTNANLALPLQGVSALAGKNGSGKTTILNMLLGIERPDQGTVLCDGLPYDTLDLHHLRRQIGISPQNPTLFPGTIRENIVFGTDDVSDQQLKVAVTQADLDPVLSQLPEGLDTQIGENGVMLSGGQRQRIAIARALVRAPHLLIFDEPTNHLDEGTISRIFSGLLSQDDPPAILMVSHDEKAIRFADRVFRVHNGRVEEQDSLALS